MKPVLTLLLFVSVLHANAQLDSCNIFLKGAYLEAGINQIGAFGSTINAPDRYIARPSGTPGSNTFYDACDAAAPYSQRPRGIGFIADPDKDGWLVGSPAFYGDYFLPGLPQEGWTIAANGTEVKAYTENLNTSGASGFSVSTLSGSNISYSASGSKVSGLWQGNLNFSSAANISIRQTTTLDTNSLYVTCRITLKNTGTAAVNNVYYMRTLDPDNDQTLSGDYTTRNVVTSQIPNPKNRVVVSTWGIHYTNAFLGLGTVDCRAKAFVCTSGLAPSSTSAQIYAGTATDVRYDSLTADDGVGLVFSLGSIAAGDSTSFYFAYIFKPSYIDTALVNNSSTIYNWTAGGSTTQHLSGDTVRFCSVSAVNLNITNPGTATWNWISPTGNTITPATGTSVFVNVSTGIAVFKAYSSGGGACATIDTITMIVNPYGADSVPVVKITGPHKQYTGNYVTVNISVKNAGPTYTLVWRKNGAVILTTSVGPYPITYVKPAGNDTITVTAIPYGSVCYDTAVSDTLIVYNYYLGTPQINTGQKDIIIYPNPLKNEMNISGLELSDYITVYDMLGKKTREWLATKDGTNIFITADLPPGMYILRVLDKNGIIKANLPIQKL